MRPQSLVSLMRVVVDMRAEAVNLRKRARAAPSVATADRTLAEAVCIEHWAAQLQRVVDDEAGDMIPPELTNPPG